MDKVKEALSNGSSSRIRTKACILQGYVLSKFWYYTFILDVENKVDELDNLIKDFLWTNSYLGKAYKARTKMRYERTHLPRSLGGLGIFDLHSRFQGQKAWIIDFALHEKSKIGPILTRIRTRNYFSNV